MPDDKDYANAAVVAIARMWATLFFELVNQGMSRSEALNLVKAYVTAAASGSGPDKESPGSTPTVQG